MKNYPSSVTAGRSIEHIEHYLVGKKALNISKTYKDGKLDAIFFQVELNNVPVPFKLPANVEACYRSLKKLRKRPPTKAQEKTLREQAERTAWKIISDWLEIQMALIEMEQAEFLEIFLPYVATAEGGTFYQKMKQENFKLLPGAS